MVPRFVRVVDELPKTPTQNAGPGLTDNDRDMRALQVVVTPRISTRLTSKRGTTVGDGRATLWVNYIVAGAK